MDNVYDAITMATPFNTDLQIHTRQAGQTCI